MCLFLLLGDLIIVMVAFYLSCAILNKLVLTQIYKLLSIGPGQYLGLLLGTLGATGMGSDIDAA